MAFDDDVLLLGRDDAGHLVETFERRGQQVRAVRTKKDTSGEDDHHAALVGLGGGAVESVIRLLGPLLGRGGVGVGGTSLPFGRIGLLLGSLASGALDADLLRLLGLAALGFSQLSARRAQG